MRPKILGRSRAVVSEPAGLGGAWELAFPISSQVVLMLPVGRGSRTAHLSIPEALHQVAQSERLPIGGPPKVWGTFGQLCASDPPQGPLIPCPCRRAFQASKVVSDLLHETNGNEWSSNEPQSFNMGPFGANVTSVWGIWKGLTLASLFSQFVNSQ